MEESGFFECGYPGCGHTSDSGMARYGQCLVVVRHWNVQVNRDRYQ